MHPVVVAQLPEAVTPVLATYTVGVVVAVVDDPGATTKSTALSG
jgi:hypothetical protein